MAGRYVGYFNGLDGKHYLVQFEKSGSTGNYTEIKLAGDEPFVVNYETSNSPFDAVRTSTASINVVHNSYLQDIMTPYAMGTCVRLIEYTGQIYTGQTGTVIWEGYLKPTVYDASYENEYETFEIVANDYLLTLQYLKYTDESAYTKDIVSISDILGKICDMVGIDDGFYWTSTKQVNNSILLPTVLKISEQNFFSNDTDEPWMMDEVLSEICKYFGFTAVQWRNGLYLIDYRNYHTSDSITFRHYTAPYTTPSIVQKTEIKNITQTNVRGNGASVTFEPIYNKCKVNCNFNEIKTFIPDLFDDNLLTNRMSSGNFYTNCEILPEQPYNARYQWNSKYKTESVGDDTYRYFHRLYDHKNWESVYWMNTGSSTNPMHIYLADFMYRSSAVTSYCAGGTIVDMGVVKKMYYDHSTGQYVVPNRLDYTRYLCISQKALGATGSSINCPVMRLKSGYKSIAPFSDNAFLVINYSIILEKYVNRAYINPEWTTEGVRGDNYTGTHYPSLFFKLKIGDKYWNGTQWTTTQSTFIAPTKRESDTEMYFNTSVDCLNNVSWDEYVNEEGYKIPLSGVDTCAVIECEIQFPNLQVRVDKEKLSEYDSNHWNMYCWVKDFKLTVAEKGQDAEKAESDVVYENDIDVDAVNELDEISLKITTSTELTKPSYSNVIYYNGTRNTMLSGVKETNISNIEQKPEYNIVQKYVDYYNTSTKKIQIKLENEYTPFDIFYRVDTTDNSKSFITLGSEIDYGAGTQNITMIENK